jgi:hypothetical protein
VLLKCREVTRAEAGTIFLVRGRGARRRLEPVSVQNDRARTPRRLLELPVDHGSIAGHVAATGETVFIDDVHRLPRGVSYRFNEDLDHRSGFRTRSVMCFPLVTSGRRTVGVVQLINRRAERRGGGAGEAVPFGPRFADIMAPVSLIIGRAIERAEALEAIALRNRRLRERNRQLGEERRRVERLSAETEAAFMMSAELLARAAELHDADTGNHVQRVNGYSALIATLAGQPAGFCAEIGWAAALHDVGKMSIDQAILRKEGPLDARERTEMRAHAEYGHAILEGHPRLAMAAEIAHCHHEMWAGGGYPRGLAGEAIPLAARIVAIADVYDALRSRRPYKPGFDHARAVAIMLEGDERVDPARHFDPRLLSLFARHHERFAEIWDRAAA